MKKSKNDEDVKILVEIKRRPEIEIIPGDFTSRLYLPFTNLKAGFPSPAEAYEVEMLDFNHDMVPHPDTTFYGRVNGESMAGAGINTDDLVVIDRSEEPKKGDIVVAFINSEYTLKYYDDSHKAEGYIELVPANKHFPRLKVTSADDFTVWGVVIYSIKNWHN